MYSRTLSITNEDFLFSLLIILSHKPPVNITKYLSYTEPISWTRGFRAYLATIEHLISYHEMYRYHGPAIFAYPI